MKKSYMKPIVTFESLAISSRIASGCALISTDSAEMVCPVVDEEAGWMVFADANNCEMSFDVYDQICYDIPIDSGKVFQS